MQSPITMITYSQIKRDLEALGVSKGMTLLVHSSLKSVGQVCGGPVALILALEELLTEEGTLIMPTFNTDLTDPAQWSRPPVQPEQIPAILEEMPAFDVDLTPTRHMGAVSETFRKQPGVIRSQHPHVSFAAWGKNAEYICGHHPLEFGLSKSSPLGRINELGSYVLLIGVGYDNNTSIHLAEYTSRPNLTIIKQKAPLQVEGARHWVEFDEIECDTSDFVALGEAFENHSDQVWSGKIGEANSKLMSQKHLVDFAESFMSLQSSK